MSREYLPIEDVVVWGGKYRHLILGQVLSLLITGTGVCSSVLSERYDLILPTTQSCLNYVLLLCLYFPKSCGFHRRWDWRYFVCAVVDVEANYCVVLAYRYTSMTSVMLLDCFTIPCAMALSRVLLHRRYHRWHVAGVVVCLLGLCLTVLSDVLGAKQPGGIDEGRESMLGDLLCLLGAALYSCSNVLQEKLVKQYPNGQGRIAFLGMLGLWGSALSAVQVAVFEREALMAAHWLWPSIGLILGFALCLFAMYSLTSLFLTVSDSTNFNLSLLTSDIYAVIFSFFIFHRMVNWLYFVAFAVIFLGLLFYGHEEQPMPKRDKTAPPLERTPLAPVVEPP